MAKKEARPPPPTPEFSRTVPLDDLGTDEAVFELEATEAERAALAKRFGLVSLESFRATVRLRKRRGGKAVRMRADFVADVTQSCVVTLEPVAEHVEDCSEINFVRDSDVEGAEIVIDPEADTEPLVGDVLDLGEIVATEMALSLNPYPRRPDAPEMAQDGGPERGPGAKSPFEILARLKRRP